MLKEKVFEVVPWPINGFSGIGGAAIWPRHTKFVCSYTVCVGMDLIEEALYSVTAEPEENLIVFGPSPLSAFQNMILEMVRSY